MEIYTFARFAAVVPWLEDLPFYRPPPDPDYFSFLLRACIHYPCARLHTTLREETKGRGWGPAGGGRPEGEASRDAKETRRGEAEIARLLFGSRGRTEKEQGEEAKLCLQVAREGSAREEETTDETEEANGGEALTCPFSPLLHPPVSSSCAPHSPLAPSRKKSWKLSPPPLESISCSPFPSCLSPWCSAVPPLADASTRATCLSTPRSAESPVCRQGESGASAAAGKLSNAAAPAKGDRGRGAGIGEREEGKERKSGTHSEENEQREAGILERPEAAGAGLSAVPHTVAERRAESREEKTQCEEEGKAEAGDLFRHPPEVLASMLYYAFFTSVHPTKLTVSLVASWLQAHTQFPLSVCRAAINYLQEKGSFHFVIDDEAGKDDEPRTADASEGVNASSQKAPSSSALPSRSSPCRALRFLSFLGTAFSRPFRRSAAPQPPLSLETTPGWLYGAAPILPHYRPLVLQLLVDVCQVLFVFALKIFGFVAVSPRCTCRTCSNTAHGCPRRRQPRPEALVPQPLFGNSIPYLHSSKDEKERNHAIKAGPLASETQNERPNREDARSQDSEEDETMLEGGLKFLRFFLYLPSTGGLSPSSSRSLSDSSVSSEGRGSGVKAPIVLIHGFGFGLLPYVLHAFLLVLRQRFWTPPEERRPVVLLEFAWLGLDGQCAQLMKQSQNVEAARARARERRRAGPSSPRRGGSDALEDVSLPLPLLWTDIVPLMPAVCRSLSDFLEDLHRVQVEALERSATLAASLQAAQGGGTTQREEEERVRSPHGLDKPGPAEDAERTPQATCPEVEDWETPVRPWGDQETYLEKFGVQIDVVAHSYGTGITSCLHMRHPSLLRRCVLVDPVCFLPNCTVKAQLVHRQPWEIRLLPRHSLREAEGTAGGVFLAHAARENPETRKTLGADPTHRRDTDPETPEAGNRLSVVAAERQALAGAFASKAGDPGEGGEAEAASNGAAREVSASPSLPPTGQQSKALQAWGVHLASSLRVALLHAIDRAALFFYWLVVYREVGTRITTSRQLQGHEYLDRGGLLHLQDRLMVVLGGFDLISPAAHIKAFVDRVAPRVKCLYCPGAHHGVVAFLPSVLATIDKFLAA
ncbi:conserved hypothetical protein [Neospora caninum Liverpool]|uniref:Alpha/beta hydrolase family protein n=1 Tax=Neospora caninum (strain Liverpool) TaxID=572307 RepID=F0VRP5_NEOCL|nr:conserved hypothetical protein [Neospora caninum Liverpool]CBZ56393.1 conserved hypothetical protein [Neospora caninum Liverpool]CEL71153.1 TPA: hypothetical protein BN1204_068170 [Neospora caninum Liverpool]|eukprot:XP_003886418.1 conserved hypothetical protein [Neospora caninum Liverpool]